jgi:hypothetical protein
MKSVLTCVVAISGILLNAQTSKPQPEKSFAQQVVEEMLAAHPELVGLELASTPPGKKQCVIIASNEAKQIGAKCDKDEFTAMRTDKPFVEKEKEGGTEIYDVTAAIHDSQGKTIATAGIDFKPEPGQQEVHVTQSAQQIAKEIEEKIKTKERLFSPAR